MAEAGDLWRFELDPRRRLLRITKRGFWTDETMNQYEPVLVQQMRAAKMLGGETFVLVDKRDYAIQSAGVAERQQARLTALKPYHATRCAVLVPSGMLAKLQAARIGSPVDHKDFDDEAAAMAWLFPSEQPAPLPMCNITS